MAYDETLANRVRELLEDEAHPREQKMFGGLAFMVRGHMCCGILGDLLMLRLGEEGATAALKKQHTRPMDFTGKPLKTMVYVDPAGTARKASLKNWVATALAFANSLPVKKAKKTVRKRARKKG